MDDHSTETKRRTLPLLQYLLCAANVSKTVTDSFFLSAPLVSAIPVLVILQDTIR